MTRACGWIAGAALCWLCTAPLPFLDDAYIALHSAETLLAGQDRVYRDTPALVGATSPPYVAMLAVLLAAGSSPLNAARLLAAAGGLLCIAALMMLGRALRLPAAGRGLLIALVLASRYAWPQITNGLETGLAVALVAAMLAWSLTGRPYAIAAAAGFLPWLRPDLALVSAALLFWTLRQFDWRTRGYLLLIAATAFLPWTLWVRVDTGSWIPQTMAAKYAFFAEACGPIQQRAATVADGVRVWAAGFFPLSLGLIAAWRLPLGRVLGLAVLGTLAVYVLTLPGAVWHNELRYLYPILLPPAALGFAILLTMRATLARTATVVSVCLALPFIPGRAKLFPDQEVAAERIAAARWVAQETKPDARILVHDAGAVSLWANRQLVDLVGLKTPGSISVHQSVTLVTCGFSRGQAIAAIARRAQVDYLMVSVPWNQLFLMSDGLRAAGASLTEARHAPIADGYTILRIDWPD